MLPTYFPQMFEVAKAVRYFHSMGIVLHDYVDSDYIFLDSEFHAKFRFLGLISHCANVTPIWHYNEQRISPEANVFLFGCLFYEMCFSVKISYHDRLDNNSNAVAKQPSKPEIRDDEWQLIQRCCADEPKSRPTMDEVVREMEAWEAKAKEPSSNRRMEGPQSKGKGRRGRARGRGRRG
ncbi:hypothetical protein JOM56_013094 [Amanita muscaria]